MAKRDLNTFLMVGRSAKDIELKQGKTMNYCNITLAVHSGKDEECDFFWITAFDKVADYLSKYSKKGDLIMVQGRLSINKDQDGKSHTSLNAYEVNILSHKDGQGFVKGEVKKEDVEEKIINDDLPF